MNISLAMKKDPETDKAFGWVLEMYAYAVASALHDVGNILYKDFMLQVLRESLFLFIILVYMQHSICIHSHCCLISLFTET